MKDPKDILQFEQRKRDHINLALEQTNQTEGYSGFDKIQMEHQAFPEINFNEIDYSSQSLGFRNRTPFFISSMTAGHDQAFAINKSMLQACQITGWCMGVGSQRRQLTEQNSLDNWQKLRKIAAGVRLFGNIGLSQLINSTFKQIQKLTESINACAMIIHTNPLQECLQLEGTPDFKDGLKTIDKLVNKLSIPVIIKETGCGFSTKSLQLIQQTGAKVVDVSGLGGTHWGRIEGMRAKGIKKNTAIIFKNWGISTVQSLLNAKEINLNMEIWASGGIRSGLDAAKAIALGANMVGIAQPILKVALNNDIGNIVQCMRQFEYELQVAMFCTGSKTLNQLENSIL